MDYESQYEAAVLAAIKKVALAWHEEGLTFDHLEQYIKVLEMEVQCLERGK